MKQISDLKDMSSEINQPQEKKKDKGIEETEKILRNFGKQHAQHRMVKKICLKASWTWGGK